MLADKDLIEAAKARGQIHVLDTLHAWCDLEQGRRKSARQGFEAVLDRYPDYLDALEGLYSLFMAHPNSITLNDLIQRFQSAVQHTEEPDVRQQLLGMMQQIEKGGFLEGPSGNQ
jgi:hypothetical protein